MREELFLEVLKNNPRLFRLREFVVAMFAFVETNEYIEVNGKKATVLDKYEFDYDRPIWKPTDKITLPKGCMSIVTEDIETTIGRAFTNYILLEYGLEGKHKKFLNEQFTVGTIHQDVVTKMKDDNKAGPNDISLTLYKKFVTSNKFIRSLSSLFVVSDTMKTITPPKELKSKRKEVIQEAIKVHGKDALKDKKVVLAIEEQLVDFLKDYLKDDPTYNITTNKKVIEQSLKKRFISIGIPNSITNEAVDAIMQPLIEGLPKTKKDIAAMYNSVKYGSWARGIKTQVSGVMAKALTNAFLSLVIKVEDCHTKEGYKIKVTKDNLPYLVGGYLVSGGKALDKEFLEKNMNSYIEVRFPAYCKASKNNLCKKCCGNSLSMLPNAPLIVASDTGGDSAQNSLAGFHFKELKLKHINIENIIG